MPIKKLREHGPVWGVLFWIQNILGVGLIPFTFRAEGPDEVRGMECSRRANLRICVININKEIFATGDIWALWRTGINLRYHPVLKSTVLWSNVLLMARLNI